ncbi:hypothetical protein SAY86_026279 [Trapa natans]|uniref:nicotinate phosphoribosyltransferase n=1 Tax=Trapa natans TaxID=22666 RepID=A0AAN7KDJ0_TRANT|nr:hypothetical protein SAY86_026279 [Trapa natans]
MKNNSKSNSPSTVPAIPGPTNSMVTPLFTDLYQFTIAYAYRRAGKHQKCAVEGPDGGIGASKYCYMGGFDSTSNVAAGKLFGIPLSGRHSHAFVSSFMVGSFMSCSSLCCSHLRLYRHLKSPEEIVHKSLCSSDGSTTCEDFVALASHGWKKNGCICTWTIKHCFHCHAEMLLHHLEG